LQEEGTGSRDRHSSMRRSHSLHIHVGQPNVYELRCGAAAGWIGARASA
jgi:hypothetical protein